MKMQTSTAPDRSLDQRMEALKRANDIRSKRAVFKAQMKRSRSNGGGKAQALELLTEVPGWAASMKVPDLLMAVPKIGRVKTNRILAKARISPSKTMGGLTERQRGELSVAIKGS
jgi:hypothetical protein